MSESTPEQAPPPPSAITFVNFVLSLAHTAAVHFGDVPDPTGAALGVDLAAARQMIEVLALLEEKTRGNLTIEERQLLEQLLYELRMRSAQAGGEPPSAPRIVLP